MSILGRMIAWVEKAKYRLSRECCYDEVERIVCWMTGKWKLSAHTYKKCRDWKGFEIDFSDFGKTVFLTREAAEAALKGEQHEDSV